MSDGTHRGVLRNRDVTPTKADVHSVSMSAIPLILMAGLGVLVFYVLRASEQYRAGAIRTLAFRSGLHYLGNALPKSLTLEGTPFHRASKFWNVVDGEPTGTRIMAFDCRVGAGRYSWRRTVIAMESDDSPLVCVPFHPNMTIDRSGRWQVLYRPRDAFAFRGTGLTPVDELEAILNAIISASAKTLRE